MSAVLEASGLGKHANRSALTDCTLSVPAGHVVGLVGPNGAGKTTLLQLAVGLLAPSAGSITVLGGTPGDDPAQLRKVGFVAQETPTYGNLSVADHVRFGDWCNDGFDRDGATRRIESIGQDFGQRAGRLSGGQRAQLALTLALAKRPELLILDEPVTSLDPLARGNDVPPGGGVPAGEPLLALPVGGDGTLHRGRHRSHRPLVLVDPPPAEVTVRPDNYGPGVSGPSPRHHRIDQPPEALRDISPWPVRSRGVRPRRSPIASA